MSWAVPVAVAWILVIAQTVLVYCFKYTKTKEQLNKLNTSAKACHYVTLGLCVLSVLLALTKD